MNIGNWDGGVGRRILLPVGQSISAHLRRAQARKLAAMIREAGLGGCLIEPDDQANPEDDHGN